MDLLNNFVQEYTKQLNNGKIQKAYKGIISFMSDLKAYLEHKNIDYSISALYQGYMDMTYFAFTPTFLKNKKLKIAIVYMHEENKFEIWLAGINRQIQAEFYELLSRKNLGKYILSEIKPGIDSIISSDIMVEPDFDKPEELKKQIEIKTAEFISDITLFL